MALGFRLNQVHQMITAAMAMAEGEGDRASAAICQGMDFGGRTTTRAPDGLNFRPPFRRVPNGGRARRCCRCSSRPGVPLAPQGWQRYAPRGRDGSSG